MVTSHRLSIRSGAPLLVDARRRQELERASCDWPSWDLTPAQLADLELLLTGAFAPLDGFMARADCVTCVGAMRLETGLAFPAPVVLDVSDACAATLQPGAHLVLRDSEGVALAVLQVRDVWPSSSHHAQPWLVGGRVDGLRLPHHYDFPALRFTPAQIRAELGRRGWERTMAVPTRTFLHRREYERLRLAAERIGARTLLILLTDPGAALEPDHFVRVRCHLKTLARHGGNALIWLVPLPLREDVLRDTLLQAVIAHNAACTHLLVPEESVGSVATGDLASFARELKLEILAAPLGGATLPAGEVERMLSMGERLPDWYTFPEVADELAARYPPRHRRGFTIFFTGLSGAGKSTIANVLRVKLLERGGRAVTLLDGDLVRKQLSSELGFSREHRELNIRRIALVAAEITKNGGAVICAPIAPYASSRQEARQMIEGVGGFVLVFVDTPLELCEQRDRKGLYAKARAGLIEQFTGVSDIYEPPADADLVVRTAETAPEEAAERILAYLEEAGYVTPGDATLPMVR